MNLLTHHRTLSTGLACAALLSLVACSTPETAGTVPRTGGNAYSTGAGQVHVVQPGETLSRIAQSYGRTWQELARWNNLTDPNRLAVGQSLRVTPPGTTTAAAPATPTGTTGGSPSTSTETPTPSTVGTPPTTGAAGTSATGSVMPSPSAIVNPAVGMAVDPADSLTDAQGIRWSWPALGTVIVGYGDGGSKGVSIAGKPGDAVMAAADGRVVYAGSGLRGYGNLIIVKHSTSFLTAYAHNQALLVKEDQAVKRGQKIAEMGSIDADRVKLHFEVRKDGKPVDPVKYLPAR